MIECLIFPVPSAAYLGQYISGRPFEGPVTVLIKEYVQGCRNVAANELRVMAALLGPIPENTWQTAVAEGPDLPPVIRPLGFFVGEGSEDAQEVRLSLMIYNDITLIFARYYGRDNS